MKRIKIIITVMAFTVLLIMCFALTANASNRFSDVPDNFWAEDDICFCYYHGAFYSESTLFYPYGGLRRDVAVDGIRRMLDVNIATNADTPFSDVLYSSDYSGSIKWAYDNDITKGTGNGLFSPDTIITRQEFATLVYRALLVENATLPVTQSTVSFTDQSSIASWALPAVTALAKAEIIVGKPDGSFTPTGTIDRSSGATMLSKMYAVNKYPGNEILFYIRTANGAPIPNAAVYVYYTNENTSADKYPENPVYTDTYGIAYLPSSNNKPFAANIFAQNYKQGFLKTEITRSNFINSYTMEPDSGTGYSVPISGFDNMTEWATTRAYLDSCKNFGWRYGTNNDLDYHQGIDISRPTGTTVYTASSGTVILSTYDDDYGHIIQILTEPSNGGAYYFVYQHLNTRNVQYNVTVSQEQIIGTVGSTGDSTGPHLHFSISTSRNLSPYIES